MILIILHKKCLFEDIFFANNMLLKCATNRKNNIDSKDICKSLQMLSIKTNNTIGLNKSNMDIKKPS